MYIGKRCYIVKNDNCSISMTRNHKLLIIFADLLIFFDRHIARTLNRIVLLTLDNLPAFGRVDFLPKPNVRFSSLLLQDINGR